MEVKNTTRNVVFDEQKRNIKCRKVKLKENCSWARKKDKEKGRKEERWSKSLCVQEACDMVMSIVKRHVCTNVNIQKKEHVQTRLMSKERNTKRGIKKWPKNTYMDRLQIESWEVPAY